MPDMSLRESRRVQRINVEGVLQPFRAAACHKAEHGGGGSLVATANYCSLEGAVRIAAMVLRTAQSLRSCARWPRSWRAAKIRPNTMMPRWIASEMVWRCFGSDEFAAASLPRVQARRCGTADDIGGTAVYLTSDAPACTTGEQFIIDRSYTKF